MPGDPAEYLCVLVMDAAAHHVSAPRAVLGGDRELGRHGAVPGPRHAARVQHLLRQEIVQSHPGRVLGRQAEGDVAHRRVAPLARRIHREPRERREQVLAVRMLTEQGRRPGCAGGVGEQGAQVGASHRGVRPVREHLTHPLIQPEVTTVHSAQERKRDQWLGDRGQVEEVLLGHRLRIVDGHRADTSRGLEPLRGPPGPGGAAVAAVDAAALEGLTDSRRHVVSQHAAPGSRKPPGACWRGSRAVGLPDRPEVSAR